MPKKPNILLITTDTQRCDTLRCMGNPHAISPHLDRLASEGVIFDQAHTVSPVCGPARISLLTGLHAATHGTIENGIIADTRHAPFSDALAEAGYRNMLIGKSHFMAPVPDSFHIQHELHGEKSMEVDDFYGQHLKAHGYHRATSMPNPVPEDLFCEAFLVDTALQELGQHLQNHPDQPFFTFVSMLSPHSPIDPPGKWASLYNDRDLPPLNAREQEISDQPEQLKQLLGLDPEAPPPDVASLDRYRRGYYGLAAYCDHQIGRLIAWLDEKGLREDTVILFSSDHGFCMGDHGFSDKHSWYDESWRVPLIISQPGTLPQNERREFATWTDITATLLALAGCDTSQTHGFDLSRPLMQRTDSPRKCALGTLYRSCAVATRHWKLEIYFDSPDGRLFNRSRDPKEQENLYHDPEYSEIVTTLESALLRWHGDLRNTRLLQNSAVGGGPVANRLKDMVMELHGSDGESRMNEAALKVDKLACT